MSGILGTAHVLIDNSAWKGQTPAKLFWSKVDKESQNPCWLWTGSTATGYGRVRFGGTLYMAAWVAYTLVRGEELPGGYCLAHVCGCRSCVNPDHMRLKPHGAVTSAEDILARVIVADSGCWEWVGAANNGGYGRVVTGQGAVLAHRLSWRIHRGLIPDGVCCLHKCDNPCCVNPDHLYLGSHKDNMIDAVRRGASSSVKLNPESVKEIRELYAVGEHSYGDLARIYSVSSATIARAVKREAWCFVD